MRKLISMAAAAALAASIIPCGVYAADENGAGEVYYLNDFSTQEKAAQMSDTAVYSEDGTIKMSNYGTPYKLNFGTAKLPEVNTNRASIEIKLAFKSTLSGWMGYMLGLYDGDTNTGARVRLGYDDYSKVFRITGVKDGSGDWSASSVSENSITPNDWHRLCMMIDNGNYDLYLDGNKITTAPLGLNSGALTDVTALNYMNNGNFCAVYFDDILVKETGTMALRSSSVADGAEEVPVGTEKIELVFENPLSAESVQGISVDGLDESAYTVSADQVNDARTAVITLNDSPLAENTAYTVNYSVTDYTGQSAEGSIGFTTETQAAPPEPVETTVEVTPENGAVNVNSYSPVVFTYNKTIDPATVPAELTLSNGKCADVTVSGKTITVQPVNPQAFSQNITVMLPDTVKDTDGAAVPESTVTYTTMDNSVYYEHMFRDRNDTSQTTAVFPDSPYLISKSPENISSSAVKGNGIVLNDGQVVLVYKLDQGIDCAEAMEYYGTSRDGAGEAKYYMSDTKDNIVSDENIISPSKTVDDTMSDRLFSKKLFAGDGVKKYFAVVVDGKGWLPQLQYVKFNQPKPETLAADIPAADGNSVTFTFNSRIDADTVSAAGFKVNGESVIAAAADGNKLTLIFSALDFQKTYTVTAEGADDVYGTPLPELKFVTPKAIEVISSAITEGSLSAGGTATGKLTLKNNAPTDQNVMAAAAYYDDVQMLQAQAKTVIIPAGETVDVTLDALDIKAAEADNKVKLFVWLADTQQPVAAAAEITGETQQNGQ